MIKLKYNNWNDITVEIYEKIKTIEFHDNMNEVELLDVNVKLLSILCDVNEDDIINLPLTDFSILVGKAEFLKELPKYNMYDYYEINGNVYEVHRNLRSMTTGQYIDFQNLYKDKENNLKNLLACFLIPKGKKYGDGYDVMEVADELYKHMRIVDANSVMFFFTLQYQALTKVILTYSIKEMKKSLKREKDETMREQLKEAINQAIQARHLISTGIGII